jgi:hypothetical protein
MQYHTVWLREVHKTPLNANARISPPTIPDSDIHGWHVLDVSLAAS